MTSMRSLRLLAAVCLMLAGCNNGGDVTGGSINLSASGTVVYLADQETDGVFNLYLASSGVRLNPPLTSGGNVTSFALTPDKTAVVYIADQTTNDVFELYQVNIATPGVSVKLSGTLVSGGDVSSFAITPDGTSVVYLADQQFDQVFEVYRVLFSNPASFTLLNPPLPNGSGKSVKQFAVTPDSSRVVYIADQDTVNVNELYQVAFSDPLLLSVKLNSLLVGGGNVTDFAIAPNSISVVYLADEIIDQVFEIFLASVTGPGSGTSLNPPLGTGQNVTTFAVTPDSTAVIYRANEDSPTTIELYRVFFSAPQVFKKLNGTLTTGGNVASFTIAANGSAVVYSADQDILGVVELFRTPLTPVGPALKVNPTYVAGQNVTAFAITPDSSAAIYMANQPAGTTAVQLFEVSFSSLQVSSPPLNGALASGGNVKSFSITPNSANVLYLADQTTFGVEELYSVNVGSPGTSSKLNGPLVVPGGNVTAFTF